MIGLSQSHLAELGFKLYWDPWICIQMPYRLCYEARHTCRYTFRGGNCQNCFCLPSEMESTQKGKNLLLPGSKCHGLPCIQQFLDKQLVMKHNCLSLRISMKEVRFWETGVSFLWGSFHSTTSKLFNFFLWCCLLAMIHFKLSCNVRNKPSHMRSFRPAYRFMQPDQTV